MTQCSRCKVQYIGETKRQLSDSFGEHRRAIEKAITHRYIDQPTAVSNHFTLPGHSINDIELIPLELIHSNRDSIRKDGEAVDFKGQEIQIQIQITLLSCPISLAIGFLFYSTLLFLIYTKIRLHLATVCPSGPCIELPVI